MILPMGVSVVHSADGNALSRESADASDVDMADRSPQNTLRLLPLLVVGSCGAQA